MAVGVPGCQAAGVPGLSAIRERDSEDSWTLHRRQNRSGLGREATWRRSRTVTRPQDGPVPGRRDASLVRAFGPLFVTMVEPSLLTGRDGTRVHLD